MALVWDGECKGAAASLSSQTGRPVPSLYMCVDKLQRAGPHLYRHGGDACGGHPGRAGTSRSKSPPLYSAWVCFTEGVPDVAGRTNTAP